ncbi:MAG: hypothetical protein IPF71_13555 [Rhodoferax sp.]|nr:hypothetical protein [Rhodoferax sp.]
MSISRQALVNDDLSAFTTYHQRLVRRRVAKPMTFEQLTSNPLLGDGRRCSTTHGNLGTAAAVNLASQGLARCLREQKAQRVWASLTRNKVSDCARWR